MSKKSASQVKLVKKPDLPPIEEVFDEAKEMYLLTVETQCRVANRIDNLLNIRDYAINFWKVADSEREIKLDYIMGLLQLSVETYEKVLERSREFTLDGFSGTEVHDYYEGLVPEVGSLSSDDDLCRAGLVYLSVQPYGQKLIKLHQLIQQEIAKREASK